MKKTSQSLMLALLVISSYSIFPAAAEAATYYKCPPGFTWELSSNQSAVRCKRTSNAVVKNISCPNIKIPNFNRRLGTVPSTRPGRDKCIGTFTVAGVRQTTEHDPRACPSGFSYRQNYRQQRDKCVKPGTTSIVAPTLRVNQ